MLRFDEKKLSRLQNEKSGEQLSELQDENDEEQDSAYSSVNSLDTEEDGEADIGNEEAEHTDDYVVKNLETESEVGNRRDWRRARKMYPRSKQYIFIAATLPVNGKATAGGILKRMFPDANWVSGNYLHCQNPRFQSQDSFVLFICGVASWFSFWYLMHFRLEQKWIEVNMDTQVDALINAVTNGYKTDNMDPASGVIRTMVFANTVEAAEAVAKILTGANIKCVRYHRGISPEERANNLIDFQQHGGVFVCTDAAARGLDIPNVSHIIQVCFY